MPFLLGIPRTKAFTFSFQNILINLSSQYVSSQYVYLLWLFLPILYTLFFLSFREKFLLTKRCRFHCSWKLVALSLTVLTLILSSVIAYFGGKIFICTLQKYILVLVTLNVSPWVLESSHNTKILTNLGGHILSPALYWKRGQNVSAKICQKFLYCDLTLAVLVYFGFST